MVKGFDTAYKQISQIHERLINQCFLEGMEERERLCEILKGSIGTKKEEILDIIPEMRDMVEFPQNNPYHIYDVYEHTIKAFEECQSADIIVRLAVLLHDIGKPHSFQDDENGVRHFIGHGRVSADMAEKILKRIGFDENTIKKIYELIFYHDATFSAKRVHIKRWIKKIGDEQLKRLLEVKRADIKGHNPKFEEDGIKKIDDMERIMEEVKIQEDTFTVDKLEIKGKDLLQIGCGQGKGIGEVLRKLAEMVEKGEINNKREVLIEKAEELISVSLKIND